MLDGRYPRLEKFLDGRSVAVACRKHAAVEVPSSVLTLRFNFDSIPADLCAVNFYSDAYSRAIDSATLVLGTVPNATVEERSLKINKDFAADISVFPPILPPVEFIDKAEWLALARLMPVFPLSGLVALAMLQNTKLATCSIHGMDFYRSDLSIPIKGAGQRGKHHLPAAVQWLKRLLDADERFVWSGDITIEDIVCHMEGLTS